MPVSMIGYEMAIKQTFNKGIGETLSTGAINCAGNFTGFIIVLILTPYLKEFE